MKVCFVLHSSGKGGAERANLELIDGLKNKGIQCFAILPSHGPLIKELKKRNVPLRVIKYKWWMRSEGSPLWKRVGRLITNLIKIVPIAIQAKKWRVNIIYTNTITICVGAFVAKIIRLPHIWHIHEFGYEDHRLCFDLGNKIALRIMNQLSDVFIVGSKAVMEKYRKFFPDRKIKLIYCAVCVTNESSCKILKIKKQLQEASGIKCMIVGSLHKGKHQEDAIRAIGKLIDEEIDVRLYIVGEGKLKYKQYLESLIIRDDLENHVQFLGYIDNPFPVMQQADILLMCSRKEAFGRVTVEGMKAGKPVIGASSGGTKELIRDDYNGFLYTFGDYHGLTEKVKYLCQHPDEARQMSENGKQWALKKFNIEHYTEEVLTVLRRLIGKKNNKDSLVKEQRNKMISDIDYFKEDRKAKNNSGISIAMCTCNGELFLLEQLESIAKQTVLPDELIICDDKSTDGTLKVIQDFQRKTSFNIRIYSNNSKLGPTKNFEKAISLCLENMIVLSDQDDFWFSNKLEKMIKVFKNQPKTGYLFSDAVIADEKLRNSSSTMWERISFNFRQRKDYKQGNQLKVLLKHNVVTGATIAFRAELKKLILPIPEQWNHDAWIALLLSAADIKGNFIEEPLIKYRQHSNQLIGTKALSFNEQIQKAYLNKLDCYERLSKSFEDVVNRLIFMDILNANTQILLESYINHLKKRQIIHEVQYWKRWYWVFKEILNDRYNCFSNGWKSVAKDLFF